MAIWLIRAGSHGEYEQKFIQESRVYVTWDDLDVDLSKLHQRSELTAAMTQRYAPVAAAIHAAAACSNCSSASAIRSVL